MRVCLSCIELFGNGIYGGFGRATRVIGRELVKRGIEVTIVVPRRASDTAAPERIDGMTIVHIDPRKPWEAIQAYRDIDADVYHSQDTWLGTWLAKKAAPKRAHIVTFRDPHDNRDWKIETAMSGQKKLGWMSYRMSIDNPLVRHAVNKADARYCAAKFLIPKVVRKYSLEYEPGFLPTPVSVPDAVTKADRPTVCFVSRWDPRKRPEHFFELARNFPEIDFIAVGGSRDQARDQRLRKLAGDIPNLEITGIIDQFRTTQLDSIYAKSWILVNTSPREGLPNTYLEAAGHRCAILSYTDPDGFASHYGHRSVEGELVKGLDWLLTDDRWKSLGARGHDYISNVFATQHAMDAHTNAYQQVLEAA
jgi:glycosyltransferase involved in cell wall biosynthesis